MLAAYQGYFVAAKNAAGTAVSFVLSPAGETALEEAVNTEVVKIKPADIAAGTAESVTITPVRRELPVKVAEPVAVPAAELAK